MSQLQQIERNNAQVTFSQDAPDRMDGDVVDGSVDYYDFDWGAAVRTEENLIPCGCQHSSSYDSCQTCGEEDDPGKIWPEDVPCTPTVPEQTDDPGYDTVEP